MYPFKLNTTDFCGIFRKCTGPHSLPNQTIYLLSIANKVIVQIGKILKFTGSLITLVITTFFVQSCL